MATCVVFRNPLGAPVRLRKDGVGSLGGGVPESLPARLSLEVRVRVGLCQSFRDWRSGVDWTGGEQDWRGDSRLFLEWFILWFYWSLSLGVFYSPLSPRTSVCVGSLASGILFSLPFSSGHPQSSFETPCAWGDLLWPCRLS